MADKHMVDKHEDVPTDPQEVLRLLEDVRSRLRTTIWALHGMHQDTSSLSGEDLADLEQMLSETVDHILTPAFEALNQILGSAAGEVTTH